MRSVVTAEELSSYMNEMNMGDIERDQAEKILLGVQQDLESYINKPIGYVQVREYAISDGAGGLTVTHAPVVKVLNWGPTYGPANPYVEYWDYDPQAPIVVDPMVGSEGRVVDYTQSSNSSPLIIPGGIYVGLTYAWHYIEYVAGLDPDTHIAGQSIREAIKRVAARDAGVQFNDGLNLRQGNAEQASAGDTREKGWTEDELIAFDRIRRRTVL